MTELSEDEAIALREALDDEYRAWATYDRVVHDFGAVPPFANIRQAEARHIAALQELFRRYGLAVPANPWPGRVPRYASLREACEAGAAAEIENGALYDRLAARTHHADILAVFDNLRRASQARHLRAFRRCAGHASERGGGRGRLT